jgi:hypothetical protein
VSLSGSYDYLKGKFLFCSYHVQLHIGKPVSVVVCQGRISILVCNRTPISQVIVRSVGVATNVFLIVVFAVDLSWSRPFQLDPISEYTVLWRRGLAEVNLLYRRYERLLSDSNVKF